MSSVRFISSLYSNFIYDSLYQKTTQISMSRRTDEQIVVEYCLAIQKKLISETCNSTQESQRHKVKQKTTESREDTLYDLCEFCKQSKQMMGQCKCEQLVPQELGMTRRLRDGNLWHDKNCLHFTLHNGYLYTIGKIHGTKVKLFIHT